MSSNADATLPLAEVVRALRAELEAAFDEHRGHALQFQLGPVELELELEVAREASGDAGIRFWVVSVGGAGRRADTTRHRVTLSLQPVTDGGMTAMLHDTAKSIRGNIK